MAKFAPLHDRILVRRVEEASTTRGGIIIPDSAKEHKPQGRRSHLHWQRLALTTKCVTFPLAVKEGDRILFGKYSGTEIKIDGEDFIIAKEEVSPRHPNRCRHPGQERTSRLAKVDLSIVILSALFARRIYAVRFS